MKLKTLFPSPGLLTILGLGAALLPMAALGDTNSGFSLLDSRAHRTVGEEEVLYQVREVGLRDGYLFILTASEPFVHQFRTSGDTAYNAWGNQGQGPAELEGPVSMVVREGKIFVVDQKLGNNKIVVYDYTGKFLRTLKVPALGLAGQIYSLGERLLVYGHNPGDPRLKVVDVASGETLLEMPAMENEQVVLRAEGAPSIKVRSPGEGRPAWVPWDSDSYAFWNGEQPYVEVRRFGKSENVLLLPLPTARIPFRAQDRRLWVENAVPVVDLPGQAPDPFKKLRDIAEDQVEFPKNFPHLQDMKSDAQEGVWILRGRVDEGSVWSWLRADQKPHTVVFPVGRSPMLFGDEFVVVKAVDDLGVETLELYRRTDVIRPD